MLVLEGLENQSVCRMSVLMNNTVELDDIHTLIGNALWLLCGLLLLARLINRCVGGRRCRTAGCRQERQPGAGSKNGHCREHQLSGHSGQKLNSSPPGRFVGFVMTMFYWSPLYSSTPVKCVGFVRMMFHWSPLYSSPPGQCVGYVRMIFYWSPL